MSYDWDGDYAAREVPTPDDLTAAMRETLGPARSAFEDWSKGSAGYGELGAFMAGWEAAVSSSRVVSSREPEATQAPATTLALTFMVRGRPPNAYYVVESQMGGVAYRGVGESQLEALEAMRSADTPHSFEHERPPDGAVGAGRCWCGRDFWHNVHHGGSAPPRSADEAATPHTEVGRELVDGSAGDGIRRFGQGYTIRDYVLAIEREEREATLSARAAAFGMDTAWPLIEAVRLLADNVDHVLSAHACDVYGYESLTQARDAVRRFLAAVGVVT